MAYIDPAAVTRSYLHMITTRRGDPSPYAVMPISDDEHQRYALITTGWEPLKRIVGVTLLVTIEDDRVFIHHDGTPGFADYLIDHGVPADKIVLAFYREPFTADQAA